MSTPSPAALRAAERIVKWYSTMSLGYPERISAVAEIFDAEFAAERAHTAHNMIADVTPIVFRLEQDRAELIEALRAVVYHANKRQTIATVGLEDEELHRLPEPDFVHKARAVLAKYPKG